MGQPEEAVENSDFEGIAGSDGRLKSLSLPTAWLPVGWASQMILKYRMAIMSPIQHTPTLVF